MSIFHLDAQCDQEANCRITCPVLVITDGVPRTVSIIIKVCIASAQVSTPYHVQFFQKHVYLCYGLDAYYHSFFWFVFVVVVGGVSCKEEKILHVNCFPVGRILVVHSYSGIVTLHCVDAATSNHSCTFVR